MAGVILFYRFVIVWYRELSAEEIKILTVHVTEEWTVIVNLHVLMFTLMTRYTPAKMRQSIDNMSAVSIFLAQRSKDPRMTDILLPKEEFCATQEQKGTGFTFRRISICRIYHQGRK